MSIVSETITVTKDNPVLVAEDAATFVGVLRLKTGQSEIESRFVMIGIEGTQLQDRSGEKTKVMLALDLAQTLALISNLPETIADYLNDEAEDD